MHGFQGIEFRRFYADEYRIESGLAHHGEYLGLFGDIQRRLAGKGNRVAMSLLPRHQMRQHVPRRLTIADEVVVDKIQAGRMRFLRQNEIELADQLLRGFHPRLAPVQVGYIAKLAQVRASRGKLQGPEQILVELDEVVGRIRKVSQSRALGAGAAYLPRRRVDSGIEFGDE